MNSDRKKIAISCFLGGTVGTLTALSVKFAFWPLGFIVGFVLGYVSHEFRNVVSTSRSVWRAASTIDVAKTVSETAKILGYMSLEFLKVGLGCCIFVIFFAILYGSYYFPVGIIATLLGVDDAGIIPITVLSAVMGFCVSILSFTQIYNPYDSRGISISNFKLATICFLSGISLTAFVFAGYWTMKFIVQIPRFLKFMFRVGFSVFKLIHSDLRLLCGTDATIGVGIGFAYGMQHPGGIFTFIAVMIGGITGAVLGIINYDFVSVKWLKVAPARAKN